MAMMTAAGSKLQTAHDDTAEFIRGLELTARKVDGPKYSLRYCPARHFVVYHRACRRVPRVARPEGRNRRCVCECFPTKYATNGNGFVRTVRPSSTS